MAKICGNGVLKKIKGVFFVRTCLSDRLVVAIALFLALGIIFGKLIRDAREFDVREAYRYADSGSSMLTNYDGYFFLRMAQDLGEGNYTPEDSLRAYPRPTPAPLLCRLTDWLHGATGLSLQNLGFYLPPVLSCALCVAVLLWARVLGGPWAVGMAVLGVALAPYWLEVTAVGRFDKDCLNPVFLLLLAWCLARNDQAEGKARWFWLLGALAVLILFNWWWQKAAAPLSLGYMLLYAVFGFGRAPVGERVLKIVLLSVTAIQLMFFLLPQDPGGVMLWERFRQVPDLLPMIFKTGSMATVSDAIDELTSMRPLELARLSGGSLWSFAAGLAGLAWTAWTDKEKRRAMIYLAPLLVFGLFSLHTRRFVILFFPLIGLGLGCFVERAANLPAGRTRLTPVPVLSVLLTIVLLAPSLAAAWRQHPKPYLLRGDDRLALALRRDASERAVVWNWWDYGYFLQYRAQRFTILDGGMQTLRNCVLGAVPLVSDDPVMAANWIRFFAAHGLESFAELSKARGGDKQAVAWLKEVFSGRQSGSEMFFPDVETYLFLPVDFLRINKYWLDFGTLYDQKRPEKRVHLELFQALGFQFEGDTPSLSPACRARGYTSFPTVLRAGVDRLDGPSLHTRPDPYLIHTDASPWVYAADFPVTQTLAFQLTVPTGFHHPCFEPILYDPAIGGVWRVTSCRPE